MKPCVNFSVPNTLTGDGGLEVDITFESIDDFSPATISCNGIVTSNVCTRNLT